MKRFLAVLGLLLASVSTQAQAPAPSVIGNLTAAGATCATTNACITLPLANNTWSVAVTLTGTWSATVLVESSFDNQNTWVQQGSVTANGSITYTANAATHMRVRVSAFTSGTVGAFMVASIASNPVLGNIAIGNNGTVGYINVKQYGAKGDGRDVVDAVCTNGSPVVTSATANFISNAKVGQIIFGIEDTTGLARMPQGTILSIQSQTQLTTTQNCTNNYTLRLRWGTDDSAALTAAVAATVATSYRNIGLGVLYVPDGHYLCNKQTAAACIDFTTGGPYNSITVNGDGPNSSVIWPTPSMVMGADGNGNCLDITGFDFTIENWGCDGGNFTSAVANKYAVATHTGAITGTNDPVYNLIFNVLIERWQRFAGGNTDCGLNMLSSSTTFLNSTASYNNCGALFGAGGIKVIDSILSNNAQFNTQFNQVGDYIVGGAVMLGSLSDECGVATPCWLATVGSDVMVDDSTIYGFNSGIAAQVDGTSTATFSNSRVTPYNTDTNGTGLKCLAGCVVSATNTKFRGSGTGFPINNAGTFVDGCGNQITGSVTAVTNTGTFKNCANQPLGGSCFLTSAAGPLACGNAGQGKVAIPANTTTYTINTTAIEDTSTVHLTATTANNGIPGGPTCVLPPVTTDYAVSTETAKTSFAISLSTIASITCFDWWITTP